MSFFSTVRAATVMGLIVCAFAVLIGRVAYLQTYGREKTIRSADRQQHYNRVWYARRGSICDTNGLLMACTIQTNTLFIDPYFMLQQFQQRGRSLVEMDDALSKLANILEQDPFELSTLVSERFEDRFVVVARDVDDELAKRIRELNIPGVGFVPTPKRSYPMGSLAAHLLGGTGADGAGLEGLELQFEKLLAGTNGFQRVLKEARGRPIAIAAEDYVPPQHGQHLVLTIDSTIQMIAEEQLDAACREFGAKSGEVVVLDPQTGAILALANWPKFNPENLSDSPPENRLNRAVVVPYEPGSTFKPFLAASAMMWKLTQPGEVLPINGPVYRVPTYRRTVTDVHGYDRLTVWDVLVKSSNIGSAMIAARMGNVRIHTAVTNFGFGQLTGIELPGEHPGRVYPLQKWNKYSTESVAQGYEVMVTTVQLARAFSVFANGGRLVSPYVVKGVLDADGNVVEKRRPTRLEDLPQVVDERTADMMRRILCDVPVRGTATRARSHIWNIFGKTGTAHVSEGTSGYSQNRYTSSFVGGAPYENPKVIVALVIHEADRRLAYYGGSVAAPAAGRVIEKTLAYMQVPPSPDLPLPPEHIAANLYNYSPKVYRRKPTAITAAVD